jgi:hypothetical protein
VVSDSGGRGLTAVSQKPAPKKQGGIPAGVAGLALAVAFCLVVVFSPGDLFSVLLGGAVGVASSATCVAGIAKGSGRRAGVLGVFVSALGWLMLLTAVLDIITHGRGHAG